MEKLKLLYIDDEEIHLTNFRLTFRDEYEIITALSAEEGLDKFLKEDDIAIIIADQKMPGMTGVELLTKIYKSNPEPIRMILTAYTEVDEIIDSINNGHIYQYLLKPWDEYNIRISLKQAGNLFNLSRENKRLSQRLNHVEEEERNRIARDIHDEFGQLIPAIRYRLEALKSTPDPDFEQIFGLIDRLGRAGRDIIKKLKAGIIEELGLFASIESCLNDFLLTLPDCKLEYDIIGQKRNIEENLKIAIYRIIQESFNNIIKHSKADSVKLLITFNYPNIILIIQDNGIGFSDEVINGKYGIGLTGIKERVASFDGVIQLLKSPEGSMIRVELPLENDD
jgi:two-component system, sensor histidine kinase and response regulator